MAATKGYRVAYNAHDGEQQFVSVFHFLEEGGSGNVSDLATHLATGAFPTAVAKTLRDTGQITAVTVTQIMEHGDLTPPEQDTETVAVTGSWHAADTLMARGVCGIVNLKTNVAGRGTKGWHYGFPCVSESDLDASKTVFGGTGDYLAQLNACASGLNGVLTVNGTADDYDLAVFSRARWNRGELLFLFTVTTCIATNKCHFLDRRSTFTR